MLANGGEIEEPGFEEEVGGGAVDDGALAFVDELPFGGGEVDSVGEKGARREEAEAVVDGGVVLIVGEEFADECEFGEGLGEVGLDDAGRA